MNELFFSLGIESWKPWVGALLLPPVPFLVLILLGARLMFRRRALAWLLVLLGVAGIWFASTDVAARGLRNWLLPPTRALSNSEIVELRRAPKTAIVVLGGGKRDLAPEYGVSSLKPSSMERLRYGLWLARETGLPVAFTGGIGHDSKPGTSEAEIAARIADREFGRPLRWVESEARDTRENAIKTMALLQPQGIEHVVLVTEAYHMPRALDNFSRAAAARRVRITAAPMAVPTGGRLQASDWMPNVRATQDVWLVLHEFVGRLAGA
ncbi:MAG TPA: YdcF family protein [Rubrivivax sp.]|nr:YdcF family protein [Rubrivivax sp.]